VSRRLNALRKRVKRARRFMVNTCPASRHLHMMAEALATGRKYHMLDEEPEHCAETMLSVLNSLWTLRTETNWPSDKRAARPTPKP
jgi:hypothetical protein